MTQCIAHRVRPAHLFCAALLLLFATRAQALDPAPAAATRALKIGLSADCLIGNPYSPGSSNAGAGLSLTYEFLLSPRFVIGLPLDYKQYFGHRAVELLVYGVVLKHYLMSPDSHPAQALVRPYLQYGLLQQLLHENGHSGAAVAYDAGLMAGADIDLGSIPLFVEGAVHISHLAFIDMVPRNQSYLELTTGARLRW